MEELSQPLIADGSQHAAHVAAGAGDRAIESGRRAEDQRGRQSLAEAVVAH